MSSDLAIRVDGLGKAYTIRHQHNDHVTLAQVALDRALHPLRRNEREELWALRDVGFELPQGEVLGLIGRNGAGKSTLLKLLTRITHPTTGRIDLWGRVGSLLEIGTGFHPELTGRENVYLNGSILGMTRREIDRQFDAIVEFAGVERFLDTPVKRYSSGMYVRLAFAVAAHLETEILLLDEVLAVGDQQFQQRCLARLRDVARDGRAVMLVSHQMGTIGESCSRAVVLADGRVDLVGPVDDAVRRYLEQAALAAPIDEARRTGTGEVRLTRADAGPGSYQADELKQIDLWLEQREELPGACYVAALVRDEHGAVAAHLDSRAVDGWFEGGAERWTLTFGQPWLRPGTYQVDLSVHCHGTIDLLPGACRFEVVPSSPYRGSIADSEWSHTPVLADFELAVAVVTGAVATSEDARP